MIKQETATYGGGCFWGVEELYRQVDGVLSTAVGFMGGTVANPSYEDVCTGATGHAEVLQLVYDPAKVSYEELLKIFWENHNPTTLNQQGPDVGRQYRSVIFYHTPEQKVLAEKSKEAQAQSGKWKKPIVTEIVLATTFWKAEEYHQQYLKKHGLGSCHV